MEEEQPVSERLRPHWIQRLGMLLPGFVVSAAGVITWSNSPTAGGAVFAVVLVAVSALGAVRWLAFAGVTRRGETILVRGLVWSRRIPLRQIDRVTKGYVAVHWHSRSGHRVVTPVTALWSKPRPIEIVTRYSDNNVNVIRGWIRSTPVSEAADARH
jgi:hypothetical protein